MAAAIPRANIDRIAAEGGRFTQAYAIPRSARSRVALITGALSYRLAVGLEEPLSNACAAQDRFAHGPPDLALAPKKAGYQSRADRQFGIWAVPDFGPLQSGTTISTVSAAARSITSRTNPVAGERYG